MASSQGMCKNCGSLIMFDDRDSTCECVFCHCVFPASEAVEILANPEGRTFANEKFEANSDDRHHYTTRVYSTESLEKQIQRDEITRAQKRDSAKTENEYEVTAKDVKAPKKFVLALTASILVFVAVVLAISIPSYNSRRKITESLEQNVAKIYTGDRVGYSFHGQYCQNFNLVTNDEIAEDEAKNIFDNYCSQLADAGKDDKSAVTVTIYCYGGIYTVTESDVSFQADENA